MYRIKLKAFWGVIISSVLIMVGLVSFVFFEDMLFYQLTLDNDNIESTEPRGKSVYTPEYKEDEESFVSTEKMIDSGFTEDEASVLNALNEILGNVDNKTLKAYLDLPEGDFRADTIRRLLPGVISESIEFGIRPGNSLAQAIKEHGWYKPNNKPKSWYFNNAYGIKVSSEPTKYWDGSTEVINTHEHVGGTTIGIKDAFRSYPSLWYSSMDHGLFLQKDRYAKYKILEEQDPYTYGIKLGNAGYYTTDGAEGKQYYLDLYSKNLEQLFNDHNFDRLDVLKREVETTIARNSNTSLTLSGKELKPTEWRPEGKEQVGYFVNPEVGKLIKNANYSKVEGSAKYETHGAWDYEVPTNTEIYSIKSGKVIDVDKSKGYDNYVLVQHDDGLYTRYAHLEKASVKVNQNISQGTVIGYSGKNSSNNKSVVHFELLQGGTSKKDNFVDPVVYYKITKDNKFTLKNDLSFRYYKQILNVYDYYNGQSQEISTTENNTINLRSVSNFENYGIIEDVPKDVKPVYSADNKWVNEFKVNLNGLSNNRIKVLEEATSHLGKPYLWAANGPDSFDCSGLTRWVFKNSLGVKLPRHSANQIEKMKQVTLKQAKPGDIMYTEGHIGIFLRDNDKDNIILLHAPCKKDRVKVSKYPKSKGLSFYTLDELD